MRCSCSISFRVHTKERFLRRTLYARQSELAARAENAAWLEESLGDERGRRSETERQARLHPPTRLTPCLLFRLNVSSGTLALTSEPCRCSCGRRSRIWRSCAKRPRGCAASQRRCRRFTLITSTVSPLPCSRGYLEVAESMLTRSAPRRRLSTASTTLGKTSAASDRWARAPCVGLSLSVSLSLSRALSLSLSSLSLLDRQSAPFSL
jgi:hypothetical protein